ncbi:MAG: AMP-binding protein [Akkermansiaceae bacterium]|nr:AMP-binding protein [Akkermansiaceae bacterium]MCF7731657.1 AMP-binding protein [Akkermansiaceae bacterium]
MSTFSIQILHHERLPKSGMLVIPGRLDFSLLLHLEKLFAERRVTWLVEEHAHYDPAVRGFLEQSSSGAAYSCKDAAPKEAGRQLEEFLVDGGVLIHVPGRVNVRNGTACHIPSTHLKVLCSFGLPILPVALDMPGSSALSVERTSTLPYAVMVIGKLIQAREASLPVFQQQLLEAAEEAYASRSLFKGSLPMALLEGLRKHGSKNRIIDGADDSEMTYDRVLAVALAFSQVIRKETDKQRVAIVLPPGKAGLIANLAVMFAGKTPVNLNFTAGPEAIKSTVRQSGVDRFITADPFVRKVSGFPWPPNRDLILVERELPGLTRQIIKWAILAKLLPTKVLGWWFGLNRRKGDDEALLLFTSGSSGEPKGVVLSHRNLLANVCQFSSRLEVPFGSSILGSLPLFHSFGSTVTLWFPVIEGLNLVTYPNPVDTRRNAELIALHQINILLSTPTFLRGYMKRIDPAQLASLKLVVTGAEKLPRSLAKAFEDKFRMLPQEGYGLTETSPATNLNLPDPDPEHESILIPSARSGSVGQLLPGLAIRLTDPATDKLVPLDRQGIIWFKGSNIFSGYLGNPQKTAEVLKEGWFRTGDVGRIDEDGFLYIEGRISRFSKIAGEMVPHETVEAAVNKVLGLDGETERRVAVVGVPDEQKGEAIVLLSTIAGPALEQECIDLRYRLLDEGLPSLWCPRQIIYMPEIPVLASGKLDIKGCEAFARQQR